MRLNAPQYKQQSRSDGYLSRRLDDDDYDVRHRVYCMTGRDTEFFKQKKMSELGKLVNIFHHKKRNFVSLSWHVMYSLI